MKLYIFDILITILLICGCKKSVNTITQSQSHTGIEGQVYANAGPGFHICAAAATVVVLESDSTTKVTEMKSDSTGYFKIDLSLGKYIICQRIT